MAECFICAKLLDTGPTSIVKDKGIKTLLSVSIERGEKDHENKLKNLDSVTIHTSCWRSYTRETNIAAANRRRSSSVSSPSSPSTSLQTVASIFDFHSLCFICAEPAGDDFIAKQMKIRQQYRKKVSIVTSNSIRDRVIRELDSNENDFSKAILERIRDVPDFAVVGARYHASCCKNLYIKSPGNVMGRPVLDEVDKAMIDIFQYIEDNSDECQFTMDHLIGQIKSGYKPYIKTIKQRLISKFQDRIIIFENPGMSTIVCLKNVTGHKLLSNNWYDSRARDPKEERLRVVREAAAIIREDIRSEKYDLTSYPPPDNFLHDADSQVPESLRVLLSEIILTSRRGPLGQFQRKCTSIAHAIVSAVRPRSFTSPILLGIGSFIYRKFGSRTLINILHNLGFSESYHEISVFETSSVSHKEPQVSREGYMQFIFDNADFNVRTLDGHGTFHAMGGIQCITPSNSIDPDTRLNRITENKSSIVSMKLADFHLKNFTKAKNEGLTQIKACDLNTLRHVSSEIHLTRPNFLWLYGKWMCDHKIPGWSGYIENVTKDFESVTSMIRYLPFLDAPPTNYDTVYTSLVVSAQKTAANNQQHAIVTFDQQLYWIARDIVGAVDSTLEMQPLKNVVIRPGGFHLAKNFLGSIGRIMSGSGLEKIFSMIYAENCVSKIMDGTAYSRAIRAHSLVRTALGRLILDVTEFDDSERDEIELILNDIDKSVIIKSDDNLLLTNAMNKFNSTIKSLEEKGPTARL